MQHYFYFKVGDGTERYDKYLILKTLKKKTIEEMKKEQLIEIDEQQFIDTIMQADVCLDLDEFEYEDGQYDTEEVITKIEGMDEVTIESNWNHDDVLSQHANEIVRKSYYELLAKKED